MRYCYYLKARFHSEFMSLSGLGSIHCLKITTIRLGPAYPYRLYHSCRIPSIHHTPNHYLVSPCCRRRFHSGLGHWSHNASYPSARRSSNLNNISRRFFHYTKQMSTKLPAAAFYDCVADVGRYSTFVPYCTMSEVVWRSPDGTSMLADMGIGFIQFKEIYRSRVMLEKDPPNYMIAATAIDSSLFTCMDSRWDILGTEPLSTDVKFSIDMEPVSKLHALAMQFVFEDVAKQQLNAFIRRCNAMLKPVIRVAAVDEVDFRTCIRDIISLVPSSSTIRGEFSREVFDFYSRLLDRYQKSVFSYEEFVEICRDIGRNEDIELMHRYACLSIAEDPEIAECSWEMLRPDDSYNFISRLDALVSLYFLTDDYILDRTCFYIFRQFSDKTRPAADFAAATRRIFKLQLKMLRHMLPSFIVRAVQPLSKNLRDLQEATRLIGAYGTMEDLLQKLEIEMEALVSDVFYQSGSQTLNVSIWMQYLAQHQDFIKNASVKGFISHLTMTLSNINHIR